MKQKINQAGLKNKGVEEHEEYDDGIEEDGNILNAVGKKTFFNEAEIRVALYILQKWACFLQAEDTAAGMLKSLLPIFPLGYYCFINNKKRRFPKLLFKRLPWK